MSVPLPMSPAVMASEAGGLPPIRAAAARDTAGLATLVAEAWADYPGLVFRLADAPELAAPAAHYAAKGGMLWVAEEGGAIVGSVAALPHAPGVWEIAKMYVAPVWRGRGLAEHLLATGEARAAAHGAVRLVLWSDTRFAPAHRFYEKHHYVRRAPMRVLGDSCHSLEFCFLRPIRGEVAWELDTPAAASSARRLAALLSDGGKMPRAEAGAKVAGAVRAVAAGRGRLGGVWREGVLSAGAWFAGGADAPAWIAARPRLAARLGDLLADAPPIPAI